MIAARVITSSDAWLTSVIGHPVFKVSADESEDAGAIVDQWRRTRAINGPGLYYMRLPTHAVAQVQALATEGFAIVDVTVTFERTPGPLRASAAVRPARPDDAAAVLDIAASCFSYSRFHLDPHISPAVASHVKREWIASYVRGTRGETLFVVEADGVPAGFLAALRLEHDGAPVRVIDLVGIDRRWRGLGFGRSLVSHFTDEAQGRYARLRVGTQAANVASMRLYESCGFRVVDTNYVLHAHVSEGGRS